MKKIYKLQRGGILYSAPEYSVSGYENAFLPSLAVVPFIQHEGTPSVPLVKAGDSVKEGQLIATGDAPDSIPVHSPVPGTIVRICTVPSYNEMCVDAAVIKMDGTFSILGKKQPQNDWQTIQPNDLLSMLQRYGVVNTAEVPSSLYNDVFRMKNSMPVLIVRLFDRDPVIVMDSFLTQQHMRSVAEGAAIVARAVNASAVLFAAGKSFYNAIKNSWNETVQSICTSALFPGISFETYIVEERYPVGGKREILETLQYAHRMTYNTRVLYIDAATAYSASQAVIHASPVLERYVYISGSAVVHSAMLKVRIGTRIGALIDECGGFSSEPARIVVNGLFAGSAVYDLDTPVLKSTASITVLSQDEFPEFNISDCISCGSCISVCPNGLNPMKVFTLIRNNHKAEAMPIGKYCSFCGCCSSVCPSRLPLSHIFRRLIERPVLR